MCGIIGYENKETTKQDLETLKKVLYESKIRGKHASGIAWYDGTDIQSYVKPISIDKLISEFDLNKLVHKGKVAMIAHARYSTSDIDYNQPILTETMAVVHNGVITQDSPSSWHDTYGYKCVGKNDSELILRALEQGKDPLLEFPDASISAVVLNNTGGLNYMRNARRPLWTGVIGKGTVVASTYDILNRAGVQNIQKITVDNDLQERSLCHDGKY